MRKRDEKNKLDLNPFHKKFVCFVGCELFKNQTYLMKKSESDTTCQLMLLKDEYDNLLELHAFVLTESGEFSLKKMGDV